MSKSPALRRIQADIRELSIDPSERYHAHPLEHDMFEWHFTIRGAEGTDFEGGYYHGRILLPAEYPFKAPNIIFLTPSGRFETNTKVCLSFTAYHPELWQPVWGIRLILEALISFLPSKGDGAIGALDWSSEERKKLAKKSVDYCCPVCGRCSDILKRMEEKLALKRGGGGGASGGGGGEDAKSASVSKRFQKEIEQLHAMQMAYHGEQGGSKINDDMVETSVEETDQYQDGQEEGEKSSNDNRNPLSPKKSSHVHVSSQDKVVNSNKSSHVHVSSQDKSVNSEPMDAVDSQKSEIVTNAMDEAPSPAVPQSPMEKQVLKSYVSEQDPKEHAKEFHVNQGKQDVDADVNVNVEEDADANVGVQDHVEQEVSMGRNLESPIISDPVVHTGIVVFSIIVWLLIRKLSAIIEDMKALESELKQFM